MLNGNMRDRRFGWSHHRSVSRQRLIRHRQRPFLLALEDRRLLAQLVVMNNDAIGPGSLADRIGIANSNSQANIITFDPQVFKNPQTISIEGQLELSDTDGLQQIMGPASGVTIDGGGNGRVFEVDSNVIATFSGLNITGGNSATDNTDSYGGGGILNFGILTLNNCNVNNDTSGNLFNFGTTLSGGGVENFGGSVFLNNCNFSNDSTYTDGGGLFSTGPSDIENCTFSGDHAIDGGAVYNTGNAKIEGCTITGSGSGNYGGGLYNYQGFLLLVGCTISNDSTNTTYYGGGLYNHDGYVVMEYCTVSSNAAGDYGGGMYNDGNTFVANSTFYGNQAGEHGGGLYNNSTAYVVNCTFNGNTAKNGYYGGGLYNDGTAGLLRSTFSQNTATYGGGVYNYHSATINLTNTIVAGNTASSGGPDVYADVDSQGNNLIGNTSDSEGWSQSDLLNKNPLLSPLGNYGGPTLTMALSQSSPARLAGSVVYYPNLNVPITTDQRGMPVDTPTPDIGAFQIQSGSAANPVSLVVNTASDSASPAPGLLTLRQAVNLANVLDVATTITFDPIAFSEAQTITLTSGQLELGDTGGMQRIIGSAAGVTIESDGNDRVFEIDGSVTASLSGLTITGGGGTAAGGGLLNQGNLTLSLCSVTGNSSSATGGGLANYGTATLTGCTISNNGSQIGGGFANFGSTNLSACTLSGNTAATGAGFFAATRSGSPAENAILTKCTVSGNTAVQKGGGLYNKNGVLSLTACTVSGNSAPSGGGLANGRSATLLDTIVAGNTNGAGAPSDIAGSGKATGSFNLIGIGGSGGLKNRRQGNLILTNLKRLLLAPLGRYGGPTQTMAPLPGSAAIGNGTLVKGVSTDQRGFARPLRRVDIGAVQDQGFTIRIFPLKSPRRATITRPFARPLVVRVTGHAGDPISGGLITYTAPSRNASARLSASSASINQNGLAMIEATANGVPGGYIVTASAAGAKRPAIFSLWNIK